MNTQPEALRLADAIDGAYWEWKDVPKMATELRRLHEENEALRQALAQPEQEPVGTYQDVMQKMLALRHGSLEQMQAYDYLKNTPLYTAPPKREWKGLTSDDKHFLLANAWNKKQAFDGFMEAIDKFLEEKNT